MSIFLKSARLAVPIVFFGYGVLANLSMLTGGMPDVALPDDDLLAGGLTRDLDGLYKESLPHMDMAFGVIGAVRFAVLGEARKGALVGDDNWLFTAEEARPAPDPEALARIAATVRDVKRQLALVGSELVVVPLPAKVDIYRDKSPEPAIGDGLAKLYDDFSASLDRQGVPVVDARTAMLNAQEPTFLATDTHWTPYGASTVAKAVAASGLIDGGNLTFAESAAPPVTHSGDLVKFVTTPDMAPKIGLAPEMVHQVAQTQTSATSDIFGAGGPDIVLIGTSYSANPDWGFADALMRALGRDVVSLAENGLGPLQPMRDYLASPEAGETPAAVVIWEIPVRYLTDPNMWPVGPVEAPAVAGLSDRENADG